jgi:hypothetical protein
VKFVGIVYWNWKFIENDSIFCGKSIGKPIPMLNCKIQGRQEFLEAAVLPCFKVVGGNSIGVFLVDIQTE